MASLSSVARGIVFGATGLVAIAAAVAAVSPAAFARPRAERVIERRVEKLEAMERRIEAAAQMPPKPADVRRALRRGEPLPPLPARGGSQESAAARGGPSAAARAATPRPAPPRPSAAAVEAPGPVAPATAIDDGTRSVLIREQPTPAPAPAAELLPTPQAK